MDKIQLESNFETPVENSYTAADEAQARYFESLLELWLGLALSL